MANTRTVTAPGIFADDALTVIPPAPVQGTAYRNPAISLADVERGWPYGTPVTSDVFNQIMFQLSTLVSIMDQQGILGWTNLKNYAIGDIQMGSDGNAYQAILVSGPATTPQDPTLAPTYWSPYGGRAATTAEARALTSNSRIITPARLGDVFTSGSAGSGQFMRLPGNRELQWGNVAFGAGSDGADVALTFPHAFGSTAVNLVATVRGTSGMIVGVTSNTASGAVLRISQRSEAAYAAGSIDFHAIGLAA